MKSPRSSSAAGKGQRVGWCTVTWTIETVRDAVHVKAGYGKVYPCRIRRFVAGRALELEARPPLMRVLQTYEVEPTADGAHIRHALAISGPLSGVTWLIRLNRVYQGWLDKEVGRLIEMAARRPGAADAH